MNESLVILIPAYEPSTTLTTLIGDLTSQGWQNIVIVDDGSSKQYAKIFSECERQHAIVISHKENLGKGDALKTGMRYIQDHYQNILGVISADADGQHRPKDIEKIAKALIQHPQDFILGVREFGNDVPLRSRFGNILTRKIFKWLHKLDIQDTQTGLRAFPISQLDFFIQIPSGHYEYELDCLIKAVKKSIPIRQIPIETIYIEHNQSSHFNPILDSARIYFVFFRFALISFTSFCLDLALFIILFKISNNIFISLFIARACSACFNFLCNKNLVYKAKRTNKLLREILSYALLACCIFSGAYLGILFFHHILKMHVVPAKIITDIILFVTSFLTQRFLIFGNKKIPTQ